MGRNQLEIEPDRDANVIAKNLGKESMDADTY